MKNKIFKYAQWMIILLSNFFIWWLADKLFAVSYLNNWGWIIFFISTFFIAWFLGALIIRDKKVFLAVTLSGLMSQLIFTVSWGSLLIIAVAFSALFLARKAVQSEMGQRIKIDIWNSLRVGRYFFIFAIALMLAGQYYFFNNPQIESGNLPNLGLGGSRDGLMVKIITLTDTDLVTKEGEFASVDEFVFEKFRRDSIGLEKGKAEGNFEFSEIQQISQMQKEDILEKGREDIAKMTERDVSGDEKMIDVFVEILNNHLDDFLNVDVGYMDQEMPVMHLVFSLIIFLAVYGTGMIVSWFLVFAVAIIFRFMVRIKLLSVDKKAVNMELIRIE